MKKLELKPYKSKRNLKYILFIGVFSFLSISLFGADAPKLKIATINGVASGQPVTVPITVTGFTNIGSFYLYLEYDYSKLQYSSVTKNPGLTGNYDINDIDLGNGNHRIILSYSGGIYGINLPDGSSIADIVFNFTSGFAELKWNTARDNYCKFTDPQVNKLNDTPKSDYYIPGVLDGLVPSKPLIDSIVQPVNELSTGSVELSGLPAGNWIINPGAISGTGSSYTITGLTVGTYKFTVTNSGNYTSDSTSAVVIKIQPITATIEIPINHGSGSQGISITNYPNPFHGITTIEYTIPYEGNVTINLYNHLGQQMVTLANVNQSAGKYSISGNFSGLSPGVYIARLKLTGKTTDMIESVRLNILK